MQGIPDILSTDTIAFTLLHYDVSIIELIGTISGLLSVWWATKNNVLTWYIGLVNVLAFMLVFFQVQLYADVLLQVFYFFATAYGLWSWRRSASNDTLYITNIARKDWIPIGLWTGFLSILFFAFTQVLPLLFVNEPIKPATFAVIDSILSAAGVVITILIARKKAEAWLIWVVVDFSSVFLYLERGVLFIAAEYVIFSLLAVQGYILWRKAARQAIG